MFSDETKKALSAPMDKKNVSQRPGPNGKKLNYIEAWFALDEANRIFGFDGWSSETVTMQCVTTEPVSYISKVRVTCDDVTREGWGAGHGTGKTEGEKHESAVKEAESDARKRALMTFGKPLGLACYDTSGESFESSAPQAKAKPDTKAAFRAGLSAISKCNNLAELANVTARMQERIKEGSLTDKDAAELARMTTVREDWITKQKTAKTPQAA
jgi:DNA repair and recombination protein RAD52